MLERTYDAHHPQKSPFIKDQREDSCKSDGCIHSQKYAIAEDQHDRVTCDEYRNQIGATTGSKNFRGTVIVNAKELQSSNARDRSHTNSVAR